MQENGSGVIVKVVNPTEEPDGNDVVLAVPALSAGVLTISVKK